MRWVEKFGGKMQEDLNNKNSNDLEDNLPMVNYIMLHRIYDMMSLIAKGSVGQEETSKMIAYHEQGYLLGPSPSYSPPEND
jgi:hypothetical protein